MHASPQPERGRERGFGLIEVMAAATLGAILFLAISGVFQVGLRLHLASQETTRSTALAQSQVESLVALPAGSSALNPADATAALTEGYQRRTWIVDNYPLVGAKWIEVSVWKNPGRKVRITAILPL